MAMLNRWVTMKRMLNTKVREERPTNPFSVSTITEWETWRNDVIREISKKVGEIQNAALGEQRIRDLNDEINDRMKIKEKWESRIRQLGGPDYK